MFSANENLALRQHKRRITSMIESTMSEDALDKGTMVMVMQASCRAPGCVPLETVVAIVFPHLPAKEEKDATGGTESRAELVPGLPESGTGGTFRTKILMPMSDVTREDVLDALPPQFEGGRRTMERLCIRARDVMLSQISQIMQDDDLDGKKMMAEYLARCLHEYVEGGCKAPEVGEPFPERGGEVKEQEREKEKEKSVEAVRDGTAEAAAGEQAGSGSGAASGGNGAHRAVSSTSNEPPAPRAEHADGSDGKSKLPSSTDVRRGVTGTGNFVVRRPRDGGGSGGGKAASETTPSSGDENAETETTAAAAPPPAASTPGGRAAIETATDWRRRQNTNRLVSAALSSSASPSQALLMQMSNREHAPGIRMAGCPCCDPDNLSNVVDGMLMM